MTKRIRSVAINGKTPLKIVENVTSCTTLLITNTFRPTGGWISLSSTVMTMMTPNQIDSVPAPHREITEACLTRNETIH